MVMEMEVEMGLGLVWIGARDIQRKKVESNVMTIIL